MAHSRDRSDVEILMSPEALDESSRPSHDPQILAESVDEATLLRDPRTGGSVMLNQSAGMLWQSLDGETSIADLVDDVVIATGLERAAIAGDILEAIREFGRAGMLQGVAARPLPPPPPPAPAMAGLEVGEPIPDLHLPGLDGVSHELAFSRGAWLAVNWSPSCGYCVRIAATLAEQSRSLREGGVRLVLLASGSPEQNRQVLLGTGLEASTFLRPQPALEMFQAFGTPSAYLIRDGRTAAPIAVGADRVPQLAEQAAGILQALPESLT